MLRVFYRMCVNDLVGAWILATAGVCAGFAVNQFRESPLPLVYASKAERVQQAVAQISQAADAPPALATNAATPEANTSTAQLLDLATFQALVEKKQSVVLDARPEIFHRLGHVPGALSLPREDFENAYQQHRTLLEKDKNQRIAVYCSGSSCEDSQMVSAALAKLGYMHVAIFEGGWSAWTNAHLPEETAQ